MADVSGWIFHFLGALLLLIVLGGSIIGALYQPHRTNKQASPWDRQ